MPSDLIASFGASACAPGRHILNSRGACKACGAFALDKPLRQGPWNLNLTPAQMARQNCHKCNKSIGRLGAFRGSIIIFCRECRWDTLVVGFSPDREIARQFGRSEHTLLPGRVTTAEMMALMEERWNAFRITKLRERGTVAVGLRFRVFQRDHFRCRYCGISVDEGAILHADHVVPESRGGPTTLENLVTACIDCNLGKSDQELSVVPFDIGAPLL